MIKDGDETGLIQQALLFAQTFEMCVITFVEHTYIDKRHFTEYQTRGNAISLRDTLSSTNNRDSTKDGGYRK